MKRMFLPLIAVLVPVCAAHANDERRRADRPATEDHERDGTYRRARKHHDSDPGPRHRQGTVTLLVLNPTVFVRQSGPPAKEGLPFASEFGGPALLQVVNGSREDSSRETVSSAVIKLNGRVVFGPSAFDKHVRRLASNVLLAKGTNTLEVELRGKPGGQLSCQIVQSVTNVQVAPTELSLGEPGITGQLAVTGTLADGTPVDISGPSHGTSYASDATAIAVVSETGLVTAVALGRTAISVTAGAFAAAVPVAVRGTPPTLSNVVLTHSSLPVPRESEEFVQTLTYGFEDPNGDAATLNVVLAGPSGVINSRSDAVPSQHLAGSGSRQFPFDASSPPGPYEIRIELRDAMENSSGVQVLAFSVDPSAPRFLDITGLEPSSGVPGDTIRILGQGFAAGVASENRVQFEGPARATVLSVTPTAMEVAVPSGALAGPVMLVTPVARVLSPAPFLIQPTMTITPAFGRLLPGQTVAFSIVQSGLRSAQVSCSLNGQASPGPELGALAMVPGGFTYAAPSHVPTENPVSVWCESQDHPGVQAVTTIEITAPAPLPGQASIESVRGGGIESVDGTVKVSVPPGALPADTTMRVERLDPDLLPIPSDDGYTLAAVRLEPSGVQFAQPVTITLPLRSWEPPGTGIPVFVLDETTGALAPVGGVASVDDSGLSATVPVSHFSTFVARRPLTSVEAATRRMQPQVLKTLLPQLPMFTISTAPELPLWEGLSVPVLIKPVIRDQPLPSGPGPFAAPSGVVVTAVMNEPTTGDTPPTVGPLVHASPDGWQLATVINLKTLRGCGAGQHTNGTLTIGYEKLGVFTPLELSFRVQCLDELEFDGTHAPAFVPRDGVDRIEAGGPLGYYEYGGMRIQKIFGRYTVWLQEFNRTYRFSRISIGAGGVLSHTKLFIALQDPFAVEVTGDVRVAGTIDLRGFAGSWAGDGGSEKHLVGGVGGGPMVLNAGGGGQGGEFYRDAVVLCDQAEYYRTGAGWATFCRGGESGWHPAFYAGGAGRGGDVWRKARIVALLTDIGSFIWNGAACVEGNPTACVDAGQNAGDVYQDVDAIANNQDNYIRAAGRGGSNLGPNATLDVSTFFPPSGGAGGGGAGYTVDPTIFYVDEAGGGGGGGGGGAANLKLFVGGRVTVEPGGLIDGEGGRGGQGGNGENGEGAPGGGGGGGSGAALHVVALKGMVNHGIIRAPGGAGGRSGSINEEFGGRVHRVLVDTSFGALGYRGRLRVDGDRAGADPIGMSVYRGPVMRPQFALATRIVTTPDGSAIQAIGGVTLDLGQFGQSSSILTPPEDFATSGLKSVAARVVNWFPDHGSARWTQVDLHPWQRASVFYFPGMIDSDGDGLVDGMEAAYGTDPRNPDTDGDGLTDTDEVLVHKTSPVNSDTDGDGAADGAEVSAGSQPTNAASTPEACDGLDNDLDGMIDEGFPDFDHDGHSDCVDPDDDGDGLTDDDEAQRGTNPRAWDTDGDGYNDQLEVTWRTDPLDPASHPALPARDIDLPEPEAGALFGHAVISIGDSFLISAPLKDVGGVADVGRVYQFSGRTRVLLRTFDHPAPYAGAQFGYAVASIADITGDGADEVLISAPFDEHAPSGVPLGGRVFVFSGSDGSLLADLSSPEPVRGSHFGMSLDATEGFRWELGDPGLWGQLRVVIGEPHGGTDRTGRAYVFGLESPADWTLEHTLLKPADSPYSEFGRSVSIAGFYIEPSEAGWGEGCQVAVGTAGRVYFYYADSSGSIVPYLDPLAGDRVLQIDWWGQLNLEGAGRLVGDPGYDGTALDQGAVRVSFPEGSGGLRGFDGVNPVPQAGAGFGASMSFIPRFPTWDRSWTNNYAPIHLVAVGAPGQDVGQAASSGRVFLHRVWGELAGSVEASRNDPAAVDEPGAAFGFAMASIGSEAEHDAVLAVSAPGKDVNGRADEGRVYLFDLTRADVIGPVITAFSATPGAIPPGAEATLAYSFVNGTGVIDPSVGPVTSGGATTVAPTATTTYTLTVTSAGGISVTSQTTVVVGLVPVIEAFVADPPWIDAGGTTRLTATFTGGTGMITPGALPVESGVGIEVSPTVTTTYGLTVTSPDGTMALAALTVPVYPVPTGPWFRTGSMVNGRFNHTATLLEDGRVLIVGGLSSEAEEEEVEIYDPASETFAVVGHALARHGYLTTATHLLDGTVLIVGGSQGLDKAEIFDPATLEFSPVGPLNTGRVGHTATLLNDGRVLVVGGARSFGMTDALASSEIFDPHTRTFQPAANLNQERRMHASALLTDGRVLVVGGARAITSGSGSEILASAEIYDPAIDTFTATGAMETPRSFGFTELPVLSDGRVLVTTGIEAEFYDPGTGAFRSGGSWPAPRAGHTATALPSGLVLLAGGFWWDESLQAPATLASVDLYEPEAGVFTSGPGMLDPRQQHTATVLLDGLRVLVTGGRRMSDPSDVGLRWAELYVLPGW